ncbi:hypothetical protein M409DRAFT_27231 [Zasmidium cellare ATCC 36951]|uniref:Phosphatidylinositol-specific phospholipase C X domain-containing protein n=1 Tax=Zasmidium cellare ATCC 36951 TaxID=1080233 RepID=A0A6A6C9U6_ZASCE|nr:uncharacterized protein M409DRAFT_27231 [Zasmidium cellare ATCC 36951]KAF2162226.1 hypothetical protein M409DRAFT_27231 [Zasmidium cellare ATCC 36951]
MMPLRDPFEPKGLLAGSSELEKAENRAPGDLGLQRSKANVSGEKWMARLDDDLLVSSLSIPGTHDSAAYTHPWPFIATQRMSILEQLNAGIRYFDFRCGIREDIPEMVHGPSLLGLQLPELLDIMYKWLESHPKEGLIVQIKEDRKPERSTVHFSHAIFRHIAARSERWRTANTTPSLGELRGKIQLFRRYNGPSLMAYGIDVTEWQDNPTRPFTINTRNSVQLTIQDHYSISDPKPLPDLIAIKGGDVSGLLDRASADTDTGHWYLNFTSAYEFNWYYQLPPREVAVGGYFGFKWEDGMNPRLRTFLQVRENKQRFGIVAMDFPDLGADDLIISLIMSNFKPEQTTLGRNVRFVVAAIVLLAILLLAIIHGLSGRGPEFLRVYILECTWKVLVGT